MRMPARVALIAALTCLTAFAGKPAQADGPQPALGLRAAVGQAGTAAGTDIPLELTVTNRGPAACDLAVTPQGTVRVTGLLRDGTAVSPSFSEVRYAVGLTQQVTEALRRLEPGSQVQVSTTAQAGYLSTVDPLPGGGALATDWPVDRPGRYEISLTYLTPQSVGDAPCAGVSSVATATFTVLGPRSGNRWWLLGAIALIALILALAAWLFWRGRRRPAKAAAAVLLVLTSVAGVLVVGHGPAYADFTAAGDDIQLGVELARCKGIFKSPGGDPDRVLKMFEENPELTIPVRPRLGASGSDSFHGNTQTKEQYIRWSPVRSGPNLDPGVAQDPCAELYHELAHARDFNSKEGLDERTCDRLFVETSEAFASLAENMYRTSRSPKLPPRKTYSGMELPKNRKGCDDRPEHDPRKPTACEVTKSATQCDKDLPEEPKEGQPAVTDGDPHLTTFDQRHYDFQAAGEFVAVASASGDLIVQTRQSPVAGSRTVSVNSAVALKVGGDKIQFSLVSGTVHLQLNGRTEQWQPGSHPLSGGAKAARRASPMVFGQDGYTIRWPDGSLAWVDVLGQSGLRLYLTLAASRKGQVHGLLGDFDGDPANDLPGTAAFEEIHTSFAESLRVTAENSLFTYAPGQTVSSFVDRTFPDRAVTADTLDPALRETARQVCLRAGVTESGPLAACTVDVGQTGQTAFAVSGLDLQTNPAIARLAGSVSASGAVGDGTRVTGQITDPNTAVRYPLRLDSATDFYVADWHGTSDGCDQSFSVNLVGVSNGNFPCSGQAARFHVPDSGGAYQLEVASAGGGRTGSYAFTLVTVKRRTLPVRLGDTVSDGRIDVRGREELHSFEAEGATSIRLTGLPGCDAGLAADLLDLTDQRTVAGGRQLCGDALAYVLENPAHRYGILISSVKLGTGSYAFSLRRG